MVAKVSNTIKSTRQKIAKRKQKTDKKPEYVWFCPFCNIYQSIIHSTPITFTLDSMKIFEPEQLLYENVIIDQEINKKKLNLVTKIQLQ